jgi:SAM-dependent methyltransferase
MEKEYIQAWAQKYPHNTERTVELPFICESIKKYCTNKSILDVGGIPTDADINKPMIDALLEVNAQYSICDLAGGDFVGDFFSIDFGRNFDVIIFLSSLEHFPWNDGSYAPDLDRAAFIKALNILKARGIILFTAPIGPNRWEGTFQSYDKAAIKRLSEGSSIEESYCYRKFNDKWILTDPDTMLDIPVKIGLHVMGVGCYVFKKI